MQPAHDQLEVTLIGPGYGECCVVHLGSNHWITIDSCIDSHSRQPAALSYLDSIGVDASEAVRLIVATHWHDDHIRGIGKVLGCCSNSRFCCSAALTRKEFIATVCQYGGKNPIAGGPGVREISEVLHILEKRGHQTSPIRAVMNRRILHYDAKTLAHGQECSIWVLSPSDKQVEQFFYELTAMMPGLKQAKRRAIAQTPNHSAVAVCIKIGDVSILLGSDLEETRNPETGWSVIVRSAERPRGRATIFKVPHHGSENGHNQDVWNEMLAANPYAVLTPFGSGRKMLPSIEDAGRITGLTDSAYSTATVRQAKTNKRRDPAVEKTIKTTVGTLRQAEPATGVIRLRGNAGAENSSSWQVELLNGACHLRDAHP